MVFRKGYTLKVQTAKKSIILEGFNFRGFNFHEFRRNTSNDLISQKLINFDDSRKCRGGMFLNYFERFLF